MKLITFLLTVCCLQVVAYTSAQVTYKATNKPLHVIFTEVGKITGYNFFYRVEDLAGTKNVSVDAKELSLSEFVRICLLGQGLDFYVDGKTVVIEKKKVVASTVDKVVGGKDPIEVTVRVVNEEGDPVAGVTVQEKGTKNAVATNGDGVAKIKVNSDDVLVFTAVNIISTEAAVDGRKEISVKVLGKTGKLDEVQVVAYGKTSQRFNTGNVTIITSEEIEKQPISNPLLSLQGRVPGLFVSQANGLPGGGVTSLIQGQNSITSGNDPFYVIDGMPYVQQLIPNFGNILGFSGINNNVSSFGNPLSYLNPNDIESISVLKGADATAIYGSRAGNGAILITTKKGKSGQTKITFNVKSGIGKVANKLDLLNTKQFLEMRHEALINDNRTPLKTRDYDLLIWDTTRYTDWQKELIGGTATFSNYNISFSGGTTLTQYFIGLTHIKETTVFPGSFDNNKSGLHISLNNISPNSKFKSQLTADYTYNRNKLPSVDLTQSSIRLAPNAPALYNNDGTINWSVNDAGVSTWNDATNPIAYIYNTYDNQTTNFLSNLTLGYQLLKNLEIQSNFGYNSLQTNELVKNPLIAVPPQNLPTTERSGVYINNSINSWIIEPQINYNQTWFNTKINILVGSTIQKITKNGYQILGIGFNSDEAIADINSAATINHIGSTVTEYKYNAIFTRIGLSQANRYLLNITARRDGSSRFGSANQFTNFGSIGMGWIFSEESFLKSKSSILTFGKIRASLGTTGNDQIGDYRFINTYSTVYTTVPYQGISTLRPDGLSNPYLQWEKTSKFDIGIDLSFLNEKIAFNGTYYNNKCSNQLLVSALPISTGAPGIIINLPATVKNSGVELALVSKNIRAKYFEWSTELNLTIPQNKLVSFPDIESSIYANTLVIGKPITIIRTPVLNGVDINTGAYKFKDSSGKAIDYPAYPTDYTDYINTAPEYYGGILNNLKFKQIELSFLFQFVKQIGQNYNFGLTPGARRINQPTIVTTRWQKPGDIASIQRFNSNSSLSDAYSYATSSNMSYSDASFIRLKNISLNWTAPSSINKKLHIQSLKLFTQAQNLLTITKYKGLDPETKSFNSLPSLMIVTIGISVGL